MRIKLRLSICFIAVALTLAITLKLPAAEVERPEEIKSKRMVVYDKQTYEKLSAQWEDYYDAYPSEYAYANWMYAARYAGDENYEKLLNKGLKKYRANPTLLYLKSMLKHGGSDNAEARKYLERASGLDPNYADPWFSLVIHYMIDNEDEALRYALKHLLECGAVQDEVMDFCYNILVSLDKNAVIITNGDNDTYPVWILQKVLEIRPDVTILNRSLLNADWYPVYMINHGAPRFITQDELNKLRDSISEQIKNKEIEMPPAGPFCDTLIQMVIESAKTANRPVYFSKTLYITPQLKPIAENGRDLGLVILVTPKDAEYSLQLREIFEKWLNNFRTAGLNSWRLRYSPPGDAGRMLLSNYAHGILANFDSLKKYAPDLRDDLFEWYIKNVDKCIPDKYRDGIYEHWCEHTDVISIRNWCKQKGIKD